MPTSEVWRYFLDHAGRLARLRSRICCRHLHARSGHGAHDPEHPRRRTPQWDRDGGRETARLPSLDGLRAVSIFLVLIAHLTHRWAWSHPLQTVSVFGVRIFFVISGYLITSLLLKEEGKTGTVSLRFFYLRRTLRIFPPFYVFVCVAALGAAFGWFRRIELSSSISPRRAAAWGVSSAPSS